MTQPKAVRNLYLPSALQLPSEVFAYRFYLSLVLLGLMLCLLAVRYSEISFFILVLINTLFCATVFVRCALKDLSHGRIGFALLVSLVVYAGFLYSACHTFLRVPVVGPVAELYLYVSFFLTLALWVQTRRVREREGVKVYIKKIDDFLPKSGRLCKNGNERRVFAGELQPGDEVCVKPGERFPCDGVIVRGKTSVDEQLISGSHVPAYKQSGNSVYAGTVNKSAVIYVRVEKPLPVCTLMSVVEAVKNSELRRSHFSSPLETYSAVTLVALVAVAGLKYGLLLYEQGISSWLYNSGVLLVVFALGAPLALLFADIFPVFFARWFARKNGIYIQNYHALASFAAAEAVFFDKTGTLTYGQLTVAQVYPVNKQKETELIEAAACAEQQAEGPFAAAINAYAQDRQIVAPKNDSLELFPGMGARVRCGKHTILAGRIPWIEEQGITLPKEIYQTPHTVVCVVKDNVYLGYLVLTDKLRPCVQDTVNYLKKKKKEILLISGDNEPAVAAVAEELGIEKYSANVLPKTKAEIIGNLRELGKKVVMVGDGFNDIIALLKADVSIAYETGQNVYANWVDVIISRADLYPLAMLLTIHRKIRQTSLTNAVLAFLLGLIWVEFLFYSAPHQPDWRWPVGGSLVIVGIIFFNSMRLLKIK